MDKSQEIILLIFSLFSARIDLEHLQRNPEAIFELSKLLELNGVFQFEKDDNDNETQFSNNVEPHEQSDELTEEESEDEEDDVP